MKMKDPQQTIAACNRQTPGFDKSRLRRKRALDPYVADAIFEEGLMTTGNGNGRATKRRALSPNQGDVCAGEEGQDLPKLCGDGKVVGRKQWEVDPTYIPGKDDDADEADEKLPRGLGMGIGKKKKPLDPTYVPGKDDDADEDDEKLPRGVMGLVKKKKPLDPTYAPGKDDDADEADEFLPGVPKGKKGGQKKRRTLDPAFAPGKDDEGTNPYASPKSPTNRRDGIVVKREPRKREETTAAEAVNPPTPDVKDDHGTAVKREPRKRKATTSEAVNPSTPNDKDDHGTAVKKAPRKKKATTAVEAVNPSAPDDKAPARTVKKKKTKPTSPPRSPLSPALTDPWSGIAGEDAVTKDPSELMNTNQQPNHPSVPKAKAVLKKIAADDSTRAPIALPDAHPGSPKNHPASLADIIIVKAGCLSRKDSARKRSQSRGVTEIGLGPAAPECSAPEGQGDEAANPVLDLTLERVKRWETAVNVPKGLWSQGEKDLFYRFAMRGFEPLLPKDWHYDFSTLPGSLFEVSEAVAAPPINHIRGSEFYAIRSLSALFSLGGHVRDCNLLNVQPELVIKRAIKRYIRWASDDAGLRIGSDAIPVHTICARREEESTVQAVMKVNDRLLELSDRFQGILLAASGAKDRAAPTTRPKRKGRAVAKPLPPPKYPLLTGFVISGPVVAILTLNTDPSAAKGEGGTTDSNFMCQFDVGEYGQDVWNSLAVAIAVMHIRDTMVELADNHLAGLCRCTDGHIVTE